MTQSCILVCDAGGTKCAWGATTDGNTTLTFETSGFNASTAPADTIIKSLLEVKDNLLEAKLHPGKLFFYGAGAHTPAAKNRLASIFHDIFGDCVLECDTDLLGAARAMFGNHPGVACILGTGAAAGCYDGHTIVSRVAPLGYILGDEGSGAYIGKKFLTAALRGSLPKAVTEELQQLCTVTEEDVIENVYRRPGANTYLASLCPIVGRLSHHNAVNELILDAFSQFRSNLAAPALTYMQGHGYQADIGFAGSIAHHFRNQLATIFHDLDPVFCPAPLTSLLAYHAQGRQAPK